MEVDGKAGKGVDKRIPQVYDTNKKGIHWYTKTIGTVAYGTRGGREWEKLSKL